MMVFLDPSVIVSVVGCKLNGGVVVCCCESANSVRIVLPKLGCCSGVV